MIKRILKYIFDIKSEHPLWGYRRVCGFIRYHYGLQINPKRIYRLMKANSLLRPRYSNNKAKRTSNRSKPRAIKPNQIWGIDMTKVMIPSYGWAYLQVVLDWYSKKIVGWSVTKNSKTSVWLEALDLAVNKQYPNGVREADELNLVSNNGSQPTSKSFAKYYKSLGINQIFTSYCNPRGNADTERVMRTIEEELVHVNEFKTFEEFKQRFDRWANWYNMSYPRSANG